MSKISDFQSRAGASQTQAMLSGAANIGNMGTDPTGIAGTMRLQHRQKYVVENGVVLESRVAAYDCLVKVGQFMVPCNMLRPQCSQGFGVGQADLPVEGSNVFVLVRDGFWGYGWIIGVEPRGWHLSTPGDDRHLFANYPQGDLNPFYDNVAYILPETDPKSSKRIWADGEQYADLLPGESATVNENRVGVNIGCYDVELSGGGSFVRVGRIDDEIKVRSTNFTMWTHHYAVKSFNDYGYISAEGREYSYQGELYGEKGIASKQYKTPESTDGIDPRPRVRFWKGFLGNLWSRFILRAKESKEDFDETLASFHVSQAGNVMVRSVGGASLERYDAIPVPRREAEEWDPEGDLEKEVEHKPLEPFDIEDPHSIGLVKSSKMAWEQKTMYQRFDELQKDFTTQEEEEVKEPKDGDKDPFGSHELYISKYKGRRAGVFVGDDGSIIIRDAWGSEIVMEGGNILINTQGNVITTANRDIVSIAGNGVVARGRKAADMSADEGIARIHAKQLVEIAGGTDEKPGGVLIEAIGKGGGVSAEEEGGDAAYVGGVVVRAEEAPVCVAGKHTYVSALKNVFVTGGDDGETRDGSVFIDGKNTIMTGAKLAMMSCEANTCLITKKTALLASDKGSALVAGHRAMIVNGKKVPAIWVDALDSELDLGSLKDIWDVLQNSEIIEPYNWQELVEKAVFSFRESLQAMTGFGIEPWMPNENFTLYEPYWHVMHDLGVKTARTEPIKIEVQKVHGTKCWPYLPAYDNGIFAKVNVGELNVQNSGPLEVISKKRKSLKDSIPIERPTFVAEFKV